MRTRKLWSFALSIVLGSLISAAVLSLSTTRANARPIAVAVQESFDEVNLYHLFEDDQEDRLAVVEGSKTVAQIRSAEEVRRAKVLQMVRESKLTTSRDYYRAAAIVQRGQSQEDILLAHDLSLTAVALGEKQAATIAASTEDRFLLMQGLKQRFGTQYAEKGGKVDLAPLEDSVTDNMRFHLGLPPLKEARANAAAFAPAS